MKPKSDADRKKQALRDNLKRRKSQLREFGANKDTELSVRQAPLTRKTGESGIKSENDDDRAGS